MTEITGQKQENDNILSLVATSVQRTQQHKEKGGFSLSLKCCSHGAIRTIRSPCAHWRVILIPGINQCGEALSDYNSVTKKHLNTRGEESPCPLLGYPLIYSELFHKCRTIRHYLQRISKQTLDNRGICLFRAVKLKFFVGAVSREDPNLCDRSSLTVSLRDQLPLWLFLTLLTAMLIHFLTLSVKHHLDGWSQKEVEGSFSY